MFYQVIGFFFFFEPKQQIVGSKIGSTSLSQKTLDRHKFGWRNYDPIIFFNSEVISSFKFNNQKSVGQVSFNQESCSHKT